MVVGNVPQDGERQPEPATHLLLTSLSSAALALAVLALTLRLDRVDLRLPLNYLQDANIFLMRAKALVEGNWIWSNPRLGMPFGADWHDFPMNITMDSGIMWLLGRFTHSPPLIVNLEWFIAIALAAALACFAFVRLDFSLPASAAFGAIYALLPYTYFRGTQHLHSVDYAVPLIALSAIELIRGRGWRRLSDVPLFAWIGCLLAGLAYAYTAFFAVFVLAAAAAIAFLKNRDLRALVPAAALIGCLGAITLLDLSPSLLYSARNGPNAAMLFKSPAEAELYALKIRYLVTPVPDHPIPLLRNAEARLAAAKYPLFLNENEWGRLGTLGSVGFLFLAVFSIGAAVSPRPSRWRMAWLLGPCAALTAACVLFATVGGFGDFFSTFVTPDIRCYARIFPFIGFFSVAAAAALIRPPLRIPLWIAIVILAGYDQAVPSYANDGRQPLYRQDDDFVRSIETVLPANSAIFQLPYTDFPNEIRPPGMLSNDLLRPYLHSSSYRWSWPAVSGTTSAEWNRMAASLPAPEMLRTITHRGFSGIWLDTAGSSAAPAITAELGAEPRRSPDGRFLFYDLRGYNKLPPDPVEVLFARGFYYEERDGTRSWHWSLQRGRITLVNPLNIARTVKLSMHIETADGKPHEVRAGRDTFRVPGIHTMSLDLPALQTLSVDLKCDCPKVQPPGAARPLYFFVSDVRAANERE